MVTPGLSVVRLTVRGLFQSVCSRWRKTLGSKRCRVSTSTATRSTRRRGCVFPASSFRPSLSGRRPRPRWTVRHAKGRLRTRPRWTVLHAKGCHRPILHAKGRHRPVLHAKGRHRPVLHAKGRRRSTVTLPTASKHPRPGAVRVLVVTRRRLPAPSVMTTVPTVVGLAAALARLCVIGTLPVAV